MLEHLWKFFELYLNRKDKFTKASEALERRLKFLKEVKEIDKKGMQQEFDSSSLDNGHIAALLAIWASHKIATAYGVMSNQVQEEDDVDRTMLPFSI